MQTLSSTPLNHHTRVKICQANRHSSYLWVGTNKCKNVKFSHFIAILNQRDLQNMFLSNSDMISLFLGIFKLRYPSSKHFDHIFIHFHCFYSGCHVIVSYPSMNLIFTKRITPLDGADAVGLMTLCMCEIYSSRGIQRDVLFTRSVA